MSNDGFDVTYPRYRRTGLERAAEDLAKADERNRTGYKFAAEDLQAGYLQLEATLGSKVPQQIRDRLADARDLAAYSYFCYGFNAVSLFWSVSCIEMALRTKYKELHPGSRADRTTLHFLLKWVFEALLLPRDIPILLQEIVHAANSRLRFKTFPEVALKRGWLKPNPSSGDLQVCWNALSDEDRKPFLLDAAGLLIQELPKLRNSMAHPDGYNLVTVPRSAVMAFELLVDFARRLWPDAPS